MAATTGRTLPAADQGIVLSDAAFIIAPTFVSHHCGVLTMQATSIAEGLKQDLEARGEYVVRANASTGWFAVFLNTWRRRTEGARLDGREGPNLVVYRTRSDDMRNHYVIPY